MHRRSRGCSSLRLAGRLAPPFGAGGENPNLARQRVATGCLLPRPGDVVEAAVRALQQQSDDVQPPPLLTADRSDRLAQHRARNAVPEALIVDAIIADAQHEYLSRYAASAQRALSEATASSGAVWRAILSQYWEHLQTVTSGNLQAPETSPGNCDPTVFVLLRPTFHDKLLAREPFKHRAQNAQYVAATGELREALHRLQQYLYYMRPEFPDAPSADTALRIEELLAYVVALYGWAQWMMWTTDARVCKRLDPGGLRARRRGAAPQIPALAFARHFQESPASRNGSMQCLALSAAVANVLGCLRRMSQAWDANKWASGAGGTGEAVVAAVESVSLVHHHGQYILNAMLAGYVAWARDGPRNRALARALRRQETFCRETAPLFPTMTSFSWSGMEQTMEPWFRASVARSLLAFGPPTVHYRAILDGIPRVTEEGPGAPGPSSPVDSEAETLSPVPRERAAPPRPRRRATAPLRPAPTDAAPPSPGAASVGDPSSGNRGTDYTPMGLAPPPPGRSPTAGPASRWGFDPTAGDPGRRAATEAPRWRAPTPPGETAAARPDPRPRAGRAPTRAPSEAGEDPYFVEPDASDDSSERAYEAGEGADEHVYEEATPTDPPRPPTRRGDRRIYNNLRGWYPYNYNPVSGSPPTIPPTTEEEEAEADAWERLAQTARRRPDPWGAPAEAPPVLPARRPRTRALEQRGPASLAALGALLTKARRKSAPGVAARS
ncbi:tegument protein VP11/12 [Ateline alphaherpesvirus 1]|uniref:Tegument protein VP11/12 n=1 Tax=Herpesvirus ateles type 1 (strain Lennette) TaxID=35243 RepID=A0A1S6JLM5_HSVA1|nr:tegument protein VP11/12 [Ateline alphaherpesvirus 1]AQS79170.1 tegument protein VP11/12 [Ateline alphaherpesvirus 1]